MIYELFKRLFLIPGSYADAQIYCVEKKIKKKVMKDEYEIFYK